MISAEKAKRNVAEWPNKLTVMTLADIDHMVTAESEQGRTEITTYIAPEASQFIKPFLEKLGYKVEETALLSMQYTISWE